MSFGCYLMTKKPDVTNAVLEDLDNIRRELWEVYEKAPEGDARFRFTILKTLAAHTFRQAGLALSAKAIVRERENFVTDLERALADAMFDMPEEQVNRVAARLRTAARQVLKEARRSPGTQVAEPDNQFERLK